MKKEQFAVLGLGRFGTSIVKTLSKNGFEVLCCDKNKNSLAEVAEYATAAAQLDITDEAALKKVNLGNFDCVIIASGEGLEASIMATLFAKRMGVKKVIAKAHTENESEILKMVGADKIVMPEKDMGERLANNLISSAVLDYINVSEDVAIVEIEAKANWIGKSLKEINIRAKFGVNVVAIKSGESFNVSPNPDTPIQSGEIMVIIGNKTDINKLM